MSGLLDRAMRSEYDSYDFERLLHGIEEFEAYVSARDSVQMVDDFRPVLSAFTEVAPRYERIADSSLLREARQNILSAIHRTVGGRSDDPLDADPNARPQLERLFSALAMRYRLVVINFNYDDLIDRLSVAWSDGFTDKRSDGSALFSPDDWYAESCDASKNLLIHMHGSVRFGSSRGEVRTPPFSQPAKYPNFVAASESLELTGMSDTVVDGRILTAGAIISGLNKGSKIIYNARPYGHYYRTVMDLVPRSERFLVLGYGWRDPHVNMWIEESIALRRPQSAVVTYLPGADVGDDTPQNRYIQKLAGQETWSRIKNSAYAPMSPEDDVAPYKIDGHIAVFPQGFVLDNDAEAALLSFFSV